MKKESVLAKKTNYKIISYFFIRLLILILPIIVLAILMKYTNPDYSEKKGHTDRGLGFAIMGGLWIIIFISITIIEMIYRIYRKQKKWYANGLLILLIIIAMMLIFV
ncbi:hypothetical protein [Aquimarina sp. I32.4]|uniref:hypothetical protein n=1 Tax=Aquimarina sp. I32.4 TaxID=2053903 RepID=UPI0011AF90ED|nr:hypothetical protein [Aquimarina sp. I32.4]